MAVIKGCGDMPFDVQSECKEEGTMTKCVANVGVFLVGLRMVIPHS